MLIVPLLLLPPLALLHDTFECVVLTLSGLVVTVTVKVQEAVLPHASVATEVTVVVPVEKNEPDAGVETIVGVPQLSVAEGVKETFLPHSPVAFETVILAGHEIVGGITSVTAVIVLQLDVQPAAFVTPTATVYEPHAVGDTPTVEPRAEPGIEPDPEIDQA